MLFSLQALRPERLVSAMETFVSRVLGLRELSPPALSLKNVLKETQSSEPILVLNPYNYFSAESLKNCTFLQKENYFLICETY
jgi:hypothetical protein